MNGHWSGIKVIASTTARYYLLWIQSSNKSVLIAILLTRDLSTTNKSPTSIYICALSAENNQPLCSIIICAFSMQGDAQS